MIKYSMKIFKAFLLLICVLVLTAPSLAFADGMIIPPENYWMDETGQKAVIFYDKGVETLVLSTSFQGNAADFAWIVPTPSKPEVSKGSDELFTSLQDLTGTDYRYTDTYGLGIESVGSTGEKSVTVVETKKIDYYDVTVLSATAKDALVTWLNDNKYDYPEAAGYILNSYIENNWYFVAMRINTESLEWKGVAQQLREGHATPVILKFETKNIVYPLKISAAMSATGQSGLNNANSNTNSNTNNNSNTNINTNVNVNTNTNTSATTPVYITGKFGEAVNVSTQETLSFDATGGFSPAQGTIEMWLRPDVTWNNGTEGYWELINVVNGEGQDIFELRRAKSSTANQIQIIGYLGNGGYNSWYTSLDDSFNWDYQKWYHLAVSWSTGATPAIYINGIAKPVVGGSESSAGWTIRNYSSGTMYIGQRGNYPSIYPARASIDEVRIASTTKSADEIGEAYTQNTIPGVELFTLFLAHFNGSLKEEKSGNNVDYQTSGQVKGVSTDELALNIGELGYPSSSSTMPITLYVFAEHKKAISGFTTYWANWVKKKEIQKLATDDQGNNWINPLKGKYFLTKLSRQMSYSQMTEDLYFRDASDNKKVGSGSSDWDQIKGNIIPLTFYALLIFAGIVLASIFSPFGILFAIGAIFQFVSKKRKVYIAWWIVQGIAAGLYLITVVALLFVSLSSSSSIYLEAPVYSASSDLRLSLTVIVILTPVLVVVALMAIIMILQIRRHRKQKGSTPADFLSSKPPPPPSISQQRYSAPTPSATKPKKDIIDLVKR